MPDETSPIVDPSEIPASPPSSSGDEELLYGLIAAPLTKLTGDIARGYPPTAPVRLPNREELTVRLVDSAQLHRLDELRGDVALHQSILFIGIGALLGFVTSLFFTNTRVGAGGWVFLGVLLGMSLLSGVFARRAARRAAMAKRRLFSDVPDHAK